METTDGFLDKLGFWRKEIARDPSCLFRIVSEQIYGTQVEHQKVREECANFMRIHENMFKPRIEGGYEIYLENLVNPKVYGGQIEMFAMSIIYRLNFEVYEEGHQLPISVTYLPDTTDLIRLCYALNNHFDVIYEKSKLASHAFCQSLVYNCLYKNVFNMGNDIDFAIQKMLYDKEYAKQKRNAYNSRSIKQGSCITIIELPEGENEPPSEIKKSLSVGVPPIPYNVAKSLDPSIYRNVELHLFNEIKREETRNEQMIVPDMAVGVKCLLKFHDENVVFHSHVQKIYGDGTAEVFIEELGERQNVPYDSLTPMPIPVYKTISIKGNNKSYIKTFPQVMDKVKQSKKKQKKGRYQEFQSFIPFMQRTSLLKLTHSQVLASPNPDRSYLPKVTNLRKWASDNLTCETFLQSTWSLAQSSTSIPLAIEAEEAHISTSELKNTCMTVSKVSKPISNMEAKSTIVTKSTKTTEVNIKTKHANKKNPKPSKTMGEVMHTVSEVVPQNYEIDIQSDNYVLPQHLNNTHSYSIPPSICDFTNPTGCSFPNYAQNIPYSVSFPYQFFPSTPPDQFPYANNIVSYNNLSSLPVTNSNQLHPMNTTYYSNGNSVISTPGTCSPTPSLEMSSYTMGAYNTCLSPPLAINMPQNYYGENVNYSCYSEANNFPMFIVYNPLVCENNDANFNYVFNPYYPTSNSQ